jgi:hypothetical protein
VPLVKLDSGLVTGLISAELPSGAIKRVARTVATDLLLCSELSRATMKGQIARGLGERLYTCEVDLEMLVDSLVLTSATSRDLEEKSLRRIKVQHIAELLDTVEWNQAAERRSGVTLKGETRDQLFGRVFGSILRAGLVDFEIVDTYFLAKAVDGYNDKSSPVYWLLSQLNERGVESVTIKTRVSLNGNFETMSDREKARKGASAVSRIMEELNFKGCIRLEIFSKLNHNRYFITKFEKNENVSGTSMFAFELGMGVDTFGRGVLEEAQKIHVLSAREWEEIWGNTSKVSPPQAALKVADFKTGLLPNLEVKVQNEWL